MCLSVFLSVALLPRPFLFSFPPLNPQLVLSSLSEACHPAKRKSAKGPDGISLSVLFTLSQQAAPAVWFWKKRRGGS